MRQEGYDEIPDEEQVIEEVLGENPRARELRLMRGALEQRRAGIQREWERIRDPYARAKLAAKLAEMSKQIEVVHNEEAIAGFVEASVRATLHNPSAGEED